MNSQKFYDKMEKVEKVGENIGINIGKFFNKTIGIIIVIASFITIGSIAFIYAIKNGIKKS